MNVNNIESTGTIYKKESLATYEDADERKQLILESVNAYPGYYGKDGQGVEKPEIIYLLIKPFKENHDTEVIRRAVSAKKKAGLDAIDVSPGQLSLFNNTYSCIRVKNMPRGKTDAYTDACEGYGLEFLKSRNLKPYTSMIKVNKFVRMQEYEPLIYKDLDIQGVYYIEVSRLPEWKDFELMTTFVKNHCEYHDFDAALGIVFSMNGVKDFIRIYTDTDGTVYLDGIRQLYEEQLEAYK